MKNSPLQVILDKGILKDRDITEAASKIIEAGGSCIQLRDKISTDRELLREAKILRSLTKSNKCIFIINDRVDIAVLSSACGVHLGQDDMPVEEARNLIGKDKFIGVSCHNIEQAKNAQSVGADYIGLGPIFRTPTKPGLEPIGTDIIQKALQEINIPAFFIGGINLDNIHEILKKGAGHIAIVSAILNSSNISEAVRNFNDSIRMRQKQYSNA